MPQLIPGYSYREVTREELTPFLERYRHLVFSKNQLDPHYAHSQTEQDAVNTLAKNLSERYTLGFGLFQGDTFVGWHIGYQSEAGVFDMAITGVLKEHRRRSLYTAFLPVILARVKDDGFQVVSSRHNLINNAVIIPKLKAGFIISGFDVGDRYGSLVQLSYFFNPLRRKLLDVRVGQSVPDDEVKELLF